MLAPASTWWYRDVWPPLRRRLIRSASAASSVDDRAAVAQRAEVLGRIKAEGAGDADACRPAAPRTVARCAWQASSTSASEWRARHGFEARHVGGLAVQVHRQNRARTRRDGGRGRGRGSSVSRSGSMSANTGRAPAIMIASAEYAADSGEVITSSPGPMSSARSDQRDGIGARADADGMRDAGSRGELRLERLDLGAEDEPAAGDDAVDRAVDGRGIVAGHERVEANRVMRLRSPRRHRR